MYGLQVLVSLVTNATPGFKRPSLSNGRKSLDVKTFLIVKERTGGQSRQRTKPPVHARRVCTGGSAPRAVIGLAADGGASRDRTGDLLLAKQALSQLSYGPSAFIPTVAGNPCESCLPHAPVSGGSGKIRTSDLTLIRGAL